MFSSKSAARTERITIRIGIALVAILGTAGIALATFAGRGTP